MPRRLNKKCKKIKTLMEGAGITEVGGNTCASHLKHLKEGALVAAYKNGARFFWPDLNHDYEETIERDQLEGISVCYLFMLRSGDIISLGPTLMQDVIDGWRKQCQAQMN